MVRHLPTLRKQTMYKQTSYENKSLVRLWRRGAWRLYLALGLWMQACAAPPADEALIHTAFGDIQIRLYNQTPEHRAYFCQLVLEGKMDSAVVGRIQRDLMVQVDARHPWGISFIAPEMKFPALRGAVAAPVMQKEGVAISDPGRFFIIQGKTQSEESLQAWVQTTQSRLSEAERKQYLQRGGAPILHKHCTVFGEVVAGMEVVDRIAAQPRNEAGAPLGLIPFRIELLTTK